MSTIDPNNLPDELEIGIGQGAIFSNFLRPQGVAGHTGPKGHPGDAELAPGFVADTGPRGIPGPVGLPGSIGTNGTIQGSLASLVRQDWHGHDTAITHTSLAISSPGSHTRSAALTEDERRKVSDIRTRLQRRFVDKRRFDTMVATDVLYLLSLVEQ